ncbi:MAG: helix-turn-helix domain-containing protein [Patescibacteria group bacterium]|jgi:sugar-specific transcriptional regulator TrmB
MLAIKKNLRELGLSDNKINAYLSVTELGEAPASRVAKKANLPRTTVISILEELLVDGYISSHKYKGTTYYWAESPKTLQEIFGRKIRLAEELEGFLSDLYRSEAAFPFANVYDTQKSIKIFIEKLLSGLPKKSVIYTIDAPHVGNYQKVFSDDYYKILLELKKQRDITTQTLIPAGTYKLIDNDKLQRQRIVIREMPEKIDFLSSLWFVGSLLVLFSGKPPFVVAVHHPTIVASFKSIYDFLWQQSQPMK